MPRHRHHDRHHHHDTEVRRPRSWLVPVTVLMALAGCVLLLVLCSRSAATVSTVADGPSVTAPDDAHSGSSSVTQASPPSGDAKMVVHMIDVGQGAATLIEFSCAAILVDTGGETDDGFDSGKHLTSYLDRFFERRKDLHQTLALLLLTHPHIDHTRNAMEVWTRYHVQNVVTDGRTDSTGGAQVAALISAADAAQVGEEKINEHDIPAEGLSDRVIDPVRCADGDPDIRVLWGDVSAENVGWNRRALKNANNDSVVTKVTLGAASFLILGDLEEAGIEALVKRYVGTSLLGADVFEVGHHGSINATTKALLDAISPKIALISVGSPERREAWTAWQYGHPRKPTIEALEAVLDGKHREPANEQVAIGAKRFESRTITSAIYATAWDGDVDVTAFVTGLYAVMQHGTP